MKKTWLTLVGPVVLTLLLGSCALGRVQAQEAKARRPAEWAQPISMPGLPNLHKVSGALYRGAQPEPQGFLNLKAMGIKTVVNLRSMHSDADELEEAGMTGKLEYVHIKINTFRPNEEHVVRFLRIMADPRRHPVFVHCKHGADRTGTMAAFYRIVFEGWSKQEALSEMTEGGYGFHSVWKNLLELIRKSDIEKLKKAAGIAKSDN
jgi:protein tyrosine/serine phosphatase